MSPSTKTKADASTDTDILLQNIGIAGDQKPAFAVETVESKHQGHTEEARTQQHRRYWARTLSVILIPSIITAWYGIIWIWLVLGIENDDAAKCRNFSGSQIYYSWFIIGVFGLSWSEYGLAGVGFAMLQTRFWKAPNLFALLMHSDATWSSPSGWLKALWHRDFSRLWGLLAFLSVLPFIAFPLSGLVFEITDGYISTSSHPLVIGRNTSTWLASAGLSTPAQNAWRMGVSPTIPGFGIVYTPPGIDRAKHSTLKQVPNTLPSTSSIPDIFLAPQAEVPVSGRAWGLRVQYNCSIVRTASEFTILSEKPLSMFSHVERDPVLVLGAERTAVNLRSPSGYTIQISNSTVDPDNVNMWSYSEMGMDPSISDLGAYASVDPDMVPVNLSQTTVLEYALWQVQFRGYYDDGTIPPFNSTLGPVVEGMGSPFILSNNGTLLSNDTFFRIRQGDNFTIEASSTPVKLDASVTDLRDFFDPTKLTDYKISSGKFDYPEPVLDVAAPIGVRCLASSGLGEATLDGVTSTFTDFEQVNPVHIVGGIGYVFAEEAWSAIQWTKFSDFYRPSHSPRELPHASLWRWQGFVNSEALLRSTMLAYGLDAINLMYGFSFGFDGGWTNTNLTASRKGRILNIASLIPGHTMGYFVLCLFCVWSGISIILGVLYGFQKRSAAKLDSFTVLKRGADMSEYLQQESLKGSLSEKKKFQALSRYKL
ncbi:hypothetical protein HJFPF1_04584 [Paramyrothecium foliicola]|nr:hypothetical protein HJFPF1_04584 [Paramyrothecium foliicola]